MFETINPGEVGVVLKDGKYTRVLNAGWHVLFSGQVLRLSTREKTYEIVEDSLIDKVDADFKDYPVDARTSDGATAKIFYSLRFNIDSKNVLRFVERFETLENAVRLLVKVESRQIVREALSKSGLKAKNLVGLPLDEIQNVVGGELRNRLGRNGITMTFFGLRSIDLGSYGALIEDQMTAKELLEKEKIETDIRLVKEEREELVEASRAKRSAYAEKATAEASVEIETMKAEKEKIGAAAAIERRKLEIAAEIEIEKMRAVAKSETIRVETESLTLLGKILTPEILERGHQDLLASGINKWDGKLPLVSGSSPLPVFDIEKFLAKSSLHPETDSDHKAKPDREEN
jgi:regulator of protease activity HflC (stomatin/prohibitin superfamily)